MIKDDIKNPERLGDSDATVACTHGDRAVGLHRLLQGDVGLVVSTKADETYFSDGVKAVIISAEKAHALGKALIELSGIDEEPVEDKPLHISLEEFRELREGDQVILRDDTTSDEVFRFGYTTHFQDEIQGKTPVTVTRFDARDDSVELVNSTEARYGWFTYKAIKEVVAKAPRHISQEEFDSIEVGDKLIIRKDLVAGSAYESVYFTSEMAQWAADEVPLRVIDLRVSYAKFAHNERSGGAFSYSKEMIQKVIKAPKEHFRVRLSTKIWYAGKGGQITLDKGYAAIMNKPHAENVVKKYGGQLIKVDYSELEDK